MPAAGAEVGVRSPQPAPSEYPEIGTGPNPRRGLGLVLFCAVEAWDLLDVRRIDTVPPGVLPTCTRGSCVQVSVSRRGYDANPHVSGGEGVELALDGPGFDVSVVVGLPGLAVECDRDPECVAEAAQDRQGQCGDVEVGDGQVAI
jgi:hypothetical protein